LLEQVVRAIEGSDIETIELTWQDRRIRVVQDPGMPAVPSATASASEPSTLVGIVAPLTGVFYARPSPDQPLFVSDGDLVTQGQVVGLIETMKLFNEVVSTLDGRVRDVLVTEGDLVEKEQVLMRVEPSDAAA
jgi:biotin carboxyl carrier protein